MDPVTSRTHVRLARGFAMGGVLTAVLLGGVGCTPRVLPTRSMSIPPTPAATPIATTSSTASPAPECSIGTVGPTTPYAALPGDSFTAAGAAIRNRAVRVGAATVAFQDFTAASGTVDGGVLGANASGLVGSGASATVFEVAPGTSTHAADIPTTFPSTNQLSVLRVDGTRTVLRGFSVQGTDQGHLYNGLRADHVVDLRASDIRVIGIPGGASAPPGETFGVNDYRSTGSEWSDVVVDGAEVGASGFGVNDATDIRICDTLSEHNAFGMGFAFWQSSGIRCVDCRAIDNGVAGFNFERVTGSNELIRPIATGNRYDFRIASDQASARVRIVDPRLTDGHFTVTLPFKYNGSPNQQRASDITLIVDGRKRSDLLRIERY